VEEDTQAQLKITRELGLTGKGTEIRTKDVAAKRLEGNSLGGGLKNPFLTGKNYGCGEIHKILTSRPGMRKLRKVAGETYSARHVSPERETHTSIKLTETKSGTQ